MKKFIPIACLILIFGVTDNAFAQLTRMMPDSAALRKEWLKTIDITTQDMALSYNHKSMASILVERADAEASLKRYSKAIDDYNKAIFFDPALKQVYRRRAVVYDRIGNYRAAIGDYEKALAGMQNDKLNSAIAWNFIAGDQFALGNFSKAVKADSTAIALWPQFAMAYANKAWSNMQLGKFQQAVDDFTESLKGYQGSYPDLAAIHRNRAEAYWNLGKYTEAINDYNSALQYAPDLRDCYWGLAVCYRDIKEYLLAVGNFSRAITLFKGDDKNLSKIYTDRAEMESRRRQYDKAIEDDSLAVACDGTNANAYSALAHTYARNGNMQQSNYWYSKALKYYQGDVVSVKLIYSITAEQSYYLGQYDKGIELSNAALAVDRSDCAAYINRGRAYLKKMNNDLAMADFNKILSIDTTKRQLPYILALYYTGKTEEAVSVLKGNLMRPMDQLAASNCYYYLACLYAMMNKTREANEAFKQAINIGFPPRYAVCSPDLDNIRDTPEFKDAVGFK